MLPRGALADNASIGQWNTVIRKTYCTSRCQETLEICRIRPSKFSVIVATDLIWILPTSRLQYFLQVSTVEMVGLVLAIITTVVKPPTEAGARLPYEYLPYESGQAPGNTCISTKPGATTKPLASITFASFACKSCPILIIFFPQPRGQ